MIRPRRCWARARRSRAPAVLDASSSSASAAEAGAKARRAAAPPATCSRLLGDLARAPEDLARAAVAAHGMLFGDDWFLAPVRLPSGVIVRVDSVAMVDTFEGRHDIGSCAELDGPQRTWRFFELSGDAEGQWLLLPPALPGVTQSPPIEEVALLRDEVANLGWAAELRIESAAARTIDRAAKARAAMPPPPPRPPRASRGATHSRSPSPSIRSRWSRLRTTVASTSSAAGSPPPPTAA